MILRFVFGFAHDKFCGQVDGGQLAFGEMLAEPRVIEEADKTRGTAADAVRKGIGLAEHPRALMPVTVIGQDAQQ